MNNSVKIRGKRFEIGKFTDVPIGEIFYVSFATGLKLTLKKHSRSTAVVIEVNQENHSNKIGELMKFAWNEIILRKELKNT